MSHSPVVKIQKKIAGQNKDKIKKKTININAYKSDKNVGSTWCHLKSIIKVHMYYIVDGFIVTRKIKDT